MSEPTIQELEQALPPVRAVPGPPVYADYPDLPPKPGTETYTDAAHPRSYEQRNAEGTG